MVGGCAWRDRQVGGLFFGTFILLGAVAVAGDCDIVTGLESTDTYRAGLIAGIY